MQMKISQKDLHVTCESFVRKFVSLFAGVKHHLFVDSDRKVPNICNRENIYVFHVFKRSCKTEAELKNHLRAHSRAIARMRMVEIIRFWMNNTNQTANRRAGFLLKSSGNYHVPLNSTGLRSSIFICVSSNV